MQAYRSRLGGEKSSYLAVDISASHSRIRDLGREIVEYGKDISEAFEGANEYASRMSAFLLNDATNPDVPAGTATIGVEIVEQLPDVAAIWVPMGDTALICGIASAAKHLRPGVEVIGIQAERAPARLLPVLETGRRDQHGHLRHDC